MLAQGKDDKPKSAGKDAVQARFKSAPFGLPLLGGSLGGLLGMYAFRHKTKHWYFRLGLPALLLLHAALLFLLLRPLP